MCVILHWRLQAAGRWRPLWGALFAGRKTMPHQPAWGMTDWSRRHRRIRVRGLLDGRCKGRGNDSGLGRHQDRVAGKGQASDEQGHREADAGQEADGPEVFHCQARWQRGPFQGGQQPDGQADADRFAQDEAAQDA